MAAPLAAAGWAARLAAWGGRFIASITGRQAAWGVGGYTLGSWFGGDDDASTSTLGGIVIGFALCMVGILGYLLHRGYKAVRK